MLVVQTLERADQRAPGSRTVETSWHVRAHWFRVETLTLSLWEDGKVMRCGACGAVPAVRCLRCGACGAVSCILHAAHYILQVWSEHYGDILGSY